MQYMTTCMEWQRLEPRSMTEAMSILLVRLPIGVIM